MSRRRLSSVTLRAWIGFAVVVALVAGVALSVGRRLEGAAAARQAVERTGDRIDRLDLLLRQVLDAEVGQRGYVIAGDPRFLDPYRSSAAAVDGTMRAIAQDVQGSDAGQQRFAELQRLVAAKFRFINRNIDVRRTQGLEAASREVAGLEGKRLMDAIRAKIAQMIAYERAQLRARTEARQQEERRTQQLVYASLLGALALVLSIGVMLLRQLEGRIRAERNSGNAATLLRAALDNIGAGVAVVDARGRIVVRNAELVRMLPEAGRLDRPPSIADDLVLASGGEPFLFERQLDGATIVVRGTPLPGRRTLITYLDVTAARRVERVQSEFVSTVSHELRTPITSIRGSLAMLAGPLSPELSGKQKSLVDIALRNAERLALLVNDILDIEKIEAGRMAFDLQACDLNQLLRDAAEANRTYAGARDVILAIGTLPRPLRVRADPNRIQQVMANLISNAVKFSDPGAIVTITAEAGDGVALVSVHDRGPGVPEAFRTRIFERFAQADASDTRTKGGTGLGLSIAKAIVEKHGGRLRFESAPGNTTFTFSLPLADAGEASA